MNDEADDKQRRWVDALEPVPALRAEIDRVAGASPDIDSCAATDARSPFGTCAIAAAGQSLQVAVDHLAAVRELAMTSSTANFAHMTLLRTAFEGGARCLWLIEPTETARERAYRGALVALESLTQVRRWAEPDRSGELFAKANRRERAFRTVMDRHGYKPNRRLNTTEMVTNYGVAWAWQLAAGFAHGLEWAITSGQLVSVRPGAYRRQSRVETKPNLDHATDLTLHALRFVDRGRATLEAYGAPLSGQMIYK